ncbi:FAD-dependent oxidoreductase [soil metagenome]
MHSRTGKPTKKKLVIVGGVAGGMSAAARARRLSEDSEIIVLERNGYVSFANCGLPYFLGKEIENHDDLIVMTPDALKQRFNLDIRIHNEVVDIDPQAKLVTVKNRITLEIYNESYDDLILAVGAAPIRPTIPGIDLPGLFALWSIEELDAIESWLEEVKPATVVVAGGGFVGLETAEQLARRGLKVTIIDGQNQVLKTLDPEMAQLIHQELDQHGVALVLESPIKEFCAPAKQKGVEPEPKSCWVVAGDHEPIAADLVVLGLGIRPEVGLARNAGLTIGELGGIRVDEFLQTSAKNVWALGDVIEVLHPVSKQWARIALAGPANRQGRIVADNIFAAKESYGGTLGTAILRVFDLAVASTGLNEEQLKLAGVPYEAVHLHPTNHASYYPGAEKLTMKVIFHCESGLLLGAQVIGKEGVDKRIDVISTAIKAGLTIRDLAELELAYAPPFGSAKDPINLAGMVGTNVFEGLIEQIQWQEVSTLTLENFCLLDVRSLKERENGYVPNSMHIPLPELRERLTEIPVQKTIVVYCQSGQRSYNATRLLTQNGFTVKNLSGGYLTWHSATTQIVPVVANSKVPIPS